MDLSAAATRKPSMSRPDSYNAVWFTAPGVVEIRQEPARRPERGEIAIRALASGISQGTELLVLRGQVPVDLELDLPTLEGSFSFPIKFGYASVGLVTECGPGAMLFEPGNLVFVHHPHQTEFVVSEESAVLLPSDMNPERGTLLANLETALNVLLDAHPRLGERVVIFGQGVVGLLVSALFRRAGVYGIATVEPSATRARVSASMGADRVFSPDAALPEKVLDWTAGVGADLVIEASGSESALNQAIDCVAFQGTVVAVSWYGTKPVELDLGRAFHRRRVRIISSQVGSIDPALEPRWNRRRRLQVAVSLLADMDVTPLISHRVPFAHARDAYELLLSGRTDTLQVVLTHG